MNVRKYKFHKVKPIVASEPAVAYRSQYKYEEMDAYARQIDEEMANLQSQGRFDQKEIEAILKEHLRTPYLYATDSA
ncbi:MAG: hypothetical protein LBR18_02160 [Tannerella sp.]|nr:hypothetical protein [Tannerella sp.]